MGICVDRRARDHDQRPVPFAQSDELLAVRGAERRNVDEDVEAVPERSPERSVVDAVERDDPRDLRQARGRRSLTTSRGRHGEAALCQPPRDGGADHAGAAEYEGRQRHPVTIASLIS